MILITKYWRILFVDRNREVIRITRPERITGSICGVCVYSEDLRENVLYPWHTILCLKRGEHVYDDGKAA